ncbi:hypothetical protein KC711_04355 [Candidatus Peregrinibacteria bacterium]|nr:hypothetical protein [Candidatus Peregrinibacteria bacterium]
MKNISKDTKALVIDLRDNGG